MRQLQVKQRFGKIKFNIFLKKFFMVNLLFDRKLLRQNRKRALKNFAQHNFLHHEIANRLVENIELQNCNFEKCLEISALDNSLVDYIAKTKKVKQIFQTRMNFSKDCNIVADDEFLPFKNESFNLIISNLNLQHINLVPQFLMQVQNLLKKDGIFIASFFGEENLFDLRKAVFEAENEVFGGISPRIIPTIDVKNAAMLLQKAGFSNPISSLDIIEVEYENAKKLLSDVKNMAQGNILLKRSRKFATRKFLDEILNNYAKIAAIEGGLVKARFEIVTMIGWKK